MELQRSPQPVLEVWPVAAARAGRLVSLGGSEEKVIPRPGSCPFPTRLLRGVGAFWKPHLRLA
jgi:hypothetical protein